MIARPQPDLSENGASRTDRLDVPLQKLLLKPRERSTLQPTGEPQTLPEPMFPQRPPGEEMSTKDYQRP